MIRVTRLDAALIAVCLSLFAPRLAGAEAPSATANPIYVLSIWTDDADDQADALTQALRSRVRVAQGWYLLETNQSFETLAIALKCPSKPDAACLQRIGDHLHADHYLWGTLARKRASGAVGAELHYWHRAKGGSDAAETYSDNLKDANDESLRAIAGSAFAKLTGAGAATFVVHAGAAGGVVVVDGKEAAQLEGGVARVDVSAGSHRVAVRIPGFETPIQSASAAPGAEQNVAFPLPPPPEREVPERAGKPFPVRQVAAYAALAAGAAFLVGSAVETGIWFDDRNKSRDDRLSVPTSVSDVCLDQVNAAAVDACGRGRQALNASTLGWVFAGVGTALVGGGVYLLATRGRPIDDGAPAYGATRAVRAKVSLDVAPEWGAYGGRVLMDVTF
ncbi:MAG: hypothetical protein M3O36_15005 [Myxococcota bacterium]|nr:hypothetical protein [Myxococcota bacterium]